MGATNVSGQWRQGTELRRSGASRGGVTTSSISGGGGVKRLAYATWADERAEVEKLCAGVGSGGGRRRKEADAIGASILGRRGAMAAAAAEVDKEEGKQESEERNGK